MRGRCPAARPAQLGTTRDGLNLAAFEAMATCLAQDKAGCMCWRRSTVPRGLVAGPAPEHVPPRRAGTGRWRHGHHRPTAVGAARRCAAGLQHPPLRQWPCQSGAALSRRGAQVLAITDSPAAPVATLAHHHLQVHTSNASPFDSYTAAFFPATRSFLPWPSYGTGVSAGAGPARHLWDQFESQRLLDLPPAAPRAANQQTNVAPPATPSPARDEKRHPRVPLNQRTAAARRRAFSAAGSC